MFRDEGLIDVLKKAVAERALDAEMPAGRSAATLPEFRISAAITSVLLVAAEMIRADDAGPRALHANGGEIDAVQPL